MKKNILSIVLCTAFGFSNAQSVRFGVKGGLNVSNFTGYQEDVKSLTGFHIGGFTELKLKKKFAIQPEFLFSTQGTIVEGFNGDSNSTIKLNYLNIPVLAKYYIADAFTFEAGPQIGFLLSAKNQGDDIHDFYKTLDFGLNLGCGYEFTDNISLGVRYTVGLTNVADNSNVPPDFPDLYSLSFKNSNFALAAAYKF